MSSSKLSKQSFLEEVIPFSHFTCTVENYSGLKVPLNIGLVLNRIVRKVSALFELVTVYSNAKNLFPNIRIFGPGIKNFICTRVLMFVK